MESLSVEIDESLKLIEGANRSLEGGDLRARGDSDKLLVDRPGVRLARKLAQKRVRRSVSHALRLEEDGYRFKESLPANSLAPIRYLPTR